MMRLAASNPWLSLVLARHPENSALEERDPGCSSRFVRIPIKIDASVKDATH
jgi:hypothetical protein